MSMNMMKTLKEAIKVQDIDLELNEIPINIFLKHNGDILEFCFIEKESEDALIVAELVGIGEELRIIPKNNIEYISLCYKLTNTEQTNENHNRIYQ